MRVWAKACTWALLAASITFSVTLLLTGSIKAAGALVVVGRTLKFLAFVPHEKAWDRFWPCRETCSCT